MMRLWTLGYQIVVLGLMGFPVFLSASGAFNQINLDDWLKQQEPMALKNLLRNISAPGTAKGSVVASPSKSNPDYFYHWIRDAGLVMDEVVYRYQEASERPSAEKSKEQYFDLLKDFIEFSKLNQATPNLSGGLGEPKFNADGSAFNGSWGRPQDDGPAIRANTLIHLANVLLRQGKESWVREHLYDGTEKSIVKKDLEYVSHHWKNASFELWEEVKGHHFHTKMVQLRALKEGAELARRLGDPGAADWYLIQARQIEPEIERHWNSDKKILVATLDREGGLDYKSSQLDSAIVLGVLQGQSNGGIFSYSSDKVLATVSALEDAFYKLYSINKDGISGIAIGRYPEDRYDGYSGGGTGNPWFINTAAFGEFYFRLAKELENRAEIKITSLNQKFYQKLIKSKRTETIFKKGTTQYVEIVRSLRSKGDSFLNRVKYHVDGTGSMSEQINRESGYMQGARDLTWSYAGLLSAIRQRK